MTVAEAIEMVARNFYQATGKCPDHIDLLQNEYDELCREAYTAETEYRRRWAEAEEWSRQAAKACGVAHTPRQHPDEYRVSLSEPLTKFRTNFGEVEIRAPEMRSIKVAATPPIVVI